MHTHVAPAENHYNGDRGDGRAEWTEQVRDVHTLCVCRSVCTSLTCSGVECVALLMELFSLPSDKQKKHPGDFSVMLMNQYPAAGEDDSGFIYRSHTDTHISPRARSFMLLCVSRIPSLRLFPLRCRLVRPSPVH